MSTPSSRKPRPYWHVDAKWLTGMLLVIVLWFTFLTYNLYQITAEEPGIDFLTMALASAFSQTGGGLDQVGDVELMREKVLESPDGSWQPIEGLNIIVYAEDIADLSPREARLWFFRQWAEPLYYKGPSGLAALADDPEMQTSIEEGSGMLALVSAETHTQLAGFLGVLALVSAGLMGLLVLFSYRFGRLGSPGCAIFLAALPGLILLPIQGSLTEAPETQAAGEQLTTSVFLTSVLGDALPVVIDILLRSYLTFLLIGFALMVVAVLGTLFIRPKKTALPKAAPDADLG